VEFLELIFPKRCLGCGKKGLYVCRTCIEAVGRCDFVCQSCERPSIDGFTHTKCRRKRGLDRLVSIWKYEKVIRSAILAIKYKFATSLLDEIAEYLLEVVERENIYFPADSCMVPIPMHWLRQNRRGFNQSFELCKKISVKLGLKLDEVLIRKKLGIPQTGLRGKQRSENIKGVFAANPAKEVRGIYILFDDVYTTGSTLKEAASVLKRAGASEVYGFTIAK